LTLTVEEFPTCAVVAAVAVLVAHRAMVGLVFAVIKQNGSHGSPE
jgi:hypothetical protein